MPTKFHEILSPIDDVERIIEKDISDIPGRPVLVRFELLGNENIVITHLNKTTGEPSQGGKPIRMTLEKKSSNGIFLYKYEEEHEESYTPLVKEKVGPDGEKEIVFPHAIYHHIKSYYHRHQHHDGEEDAHLDPCVKPENKKPDIGGEDNEALIHYLKGYEKKFRYCLEQLKTPCEAFKTEKRFRNLGSRLREIQRRCMGLRMHRLYYNSLYNSKYNTKCKVGVVDPSNLHRIAFNTENSFEKIDILDQNVHQEFGLKSTKISYRATGVGIILGIISLLLGIWSITLSCH
jgi:hypothetical protein